MFRVRKMEIEDFPFAVDIANTMNWNMGSSDFQFNMDLEPNGCFILLQDSDIVGLATCINYGQVGWFGNLIIDKAYREKGAGTLLVQHALAYLKNSGVVTVGLYAYPHLERFYSDLGFKLDSNFVVLKSQAVSSLPETGIRLRAIQSLDVSSIVGFDRFCFGTSRQKLLELILKKSSTRGYVAFEGTELIGYVAAKVFDETAEIGPLVCLRSRPKTATNLLKTVLLELKGFEAYLYLPAAESALLDVALKAGFREEFRLEKMVFGPNVAKSCIYLAESLERG
jgi:hypothetical protein